MHISKNIRYFRKSKGLTQTELGKLVDKKKETISSYETDVAIPSFEVMVKLAEVFEVSIDDLVFQDIENNGTKTPAIRQMKEDDKIETQSRIIALLEHRVAELERELKRNNPDLARELGIK